MSPPNSDRPAERDGRVRARLLVVDDEPAFVTVLSELLEEEGYEVQVAFDGEQALRLLASGDPPDLVLTDVMMPRLSGTGLLAEARRLHGGHQLPFLLLSAGPIPRVEDERVIFMEKPLRLDHLLDNVDRVLGRSTAA